MLRPALVLLFCVRYTGCTPAEPRNPSTESAPPDSARTVASGIEVVGAAPDQHDDVIETVDQALRKNGNLGAYGDLSAGIAELARSHSVRISARTDGYFVEASPRSGTGNDIAFRVNPQTLALSDVVVGEVAPPPPDD